MGHITFVRGVGSPVEDIIDNCRSSVNKLSSFLDMFHERTLIIKQFGKFSHIILDYVFYSKRTKGLRRKMQLKK